MRRFVLIVNFACVLLGGVASANDPMETLMFEFINQPNRSPKTLTEAGAALTACFVRAAHELDDKKSSAEQIAGGVFGYCDKQRGWMAEFVAEFNGIKKTGIVLDDAAMLASIKQQRYDFERNMALSIILKNRQTPLLQRR